jgi:hypothetical protein
MKHTYSIFLIIAVLALLVLGAQQQGCNQKQTGPSFNTTALSLSFVENAPPNSVNLGTPFQIYMKAENQGNYPIEAGTAKFYLSGLGNNLRNFSPIVQNQEKLAEKTSQQDGGFEIIRFAEAAEPAIAITNPFNFTMHVDACYTYSTSTQASICIGQVDGSCIISSEKIITGANTNAPIQITSLTESVQGNRLFISFLIENKGNGQVYYSDFDCDKFFGQDSSDSVREKLKRDQVQIYVDPGNEDIKCNLQNPSGEEAEGTMGLALVGRKITCSKIVGQQTYPTIIKMNLIYKYVNGISKPMTILP